MLSGASNDWCLESIPPARVPIFGEETVALAVALRTRLSSSLEARD